MASAMENVATNGQAGPVAVVQGGALAVPTLLGRTAPRIPVAGRIRAGIKVLTRRAAENQRVRAIYERGVEQGKSFDSIEREIADAVPDLKNPLAPKNVPYFTVRGEDFPNPEIPWLVPPGVDAKDRGDHSKGRRGGAMSLIYRHAEKPPDDGVGEDGAAPPGQPPA